MKLVSLSMVRNEEYWIWYSLTSVHPHVDEMLVFDNFSEDRTVDVVRGMGHIADKVRLFERFGGASEQSNREMMLEIARRTGATHVLFLDGDEIHVGDNLALCRRLLEVHEHRPHLADPPANHGRAEDPTPTDGVLVKNIGFKPVHPGFAGPGTCRPHDLVQPDTDHSCYNFAIRIASLRELRGNGKEWGLHGYLETGDVYIQSSPHTIWLPGLWYYHMSWHPRSSVRRQDHGYARRPEDLGSAPLREGVHPPDVLFRPDGPTNPTLERWGLRAARHGVGVAEPAPELVRSRS
jgi:hypothetical protein